MCVCVQFICVQGSAFTAPSHGIRHPWAGGDDGAVVESVGTSQRLQTSLIVSLGSTGEPQMYHVYGIYVWIYGIPTIQIWLEWMFMTLLT